VNEGEIMAKSKEFKLVIRYKKNRKIGAMFWGKWYRWAEDYFV